MSVVGEKIIGEIRKVAEKKPDTIIPAGGCLYVGKDHRPSCLVGHALWNLGLLPGDDSQDWWNTETFSDIYWRDEFDLDISVEEVDWIQAVQTSQDGQAPWLAAVKSADVRTAEL